MAARCLLLVLMLVCVGCSKPAEVLPEAPPVQPDPNPDSRPPQVGTGGEPFDKATIDAWKKQNSKAGWVGEKNGAWGFADTPTGLKNVIPAFNFGSTLSATPSDLSALRPVSVPFGLVISEPFFRDEGLKRVAAQHNLSYLKLSGRQIADKGLGSLSTLQNLTILDLSNTEVRGEGLKDLAGLTKLTNLNLHSTWVSNATLKHVAALQHLTHLDLTPRGKKLTSVGLTELAALKNLSSLKVAFGYSGMSARGEEPFKELAALTNLTALEVRAEGMISGDHFKQLAKLPKLASLTTPGAHFWKEDFEDLASLKHLTSFSAPGATWSQPSNKAVAFQNLTSLDLSLGAANAASIVNEVATLRKLTALHVNGNPLTDADVAKLVALENLTTLSLDVTKITDASLKELTKLKTLTALRLSHTAVTDAGMKDVATLKELTDLDLRATRVTNAGVKELVALQNLRSLNLAENRLTDTALTELAKLQNLTTLDLRPPLGIAHRGTPDLTQMGVEGLRKALPKCEIAWEVDR